MNKQKIKVNNSVLYKSKTIEVRGDVIVPDIKPDIISIINSNGNAYIYKKEILNFILVEYFLIKFIIFIFINKSIRLI